MMPAAATAPPPAAAKTLPALRAVLRLLQAAGSILGERRWTIYDPLNHRFVSIGRTAYLLLQTWRAGGTADDISDEVWTRFAETVEASDVERFAEFLQLSGLTIEAAGGGWRPLFNLAEKQRASWGSRLLHNYLMFRIPLFRPERFLNSTIELVRPLGSAKTALLFSAIGLAGFYLVSREWESFCGSFADAFSVQGAALVAISLVIVKLLHELGHAYTATHFGCRVPVIGVAFILGVPMLYSDVTDSWRLTSRRSRVLIDSAGILVDLAVASLATFAWAFLPPGPWRTLAFSLASAGWILSLAFNLNPFMKFDGYHIAADAFGLDNMQSRAMAVARWRLREILFGLGLPAPEPLPQTVRRLLTGYGWGVWIYRLIMFTGIALAIYAYFFKLAGIILFCVEIGYFILKPMWGEMRAWYAMRKQLSASPRSAVTASVFAVFMLALAAPWSSRVAIPAVIEAEHIAPLYPPVPSRIEAVHTARGRRVKAGEILLTLTAPGLSDALRQTEIKADIVQLRRARRTSDAADRESAVILDQEFQSLMQQREGLLQQIHELDLKAPIDGEVVEMADALVPGRWINQKETTLVVRSATRAQVRGYLDATDAWRVRQGASSRFVPDDIHLPSLDVTLNSIAPSGTAVLDQIELAQAFGGRVASTLNGQGQPVPAASQYAVRAAISGNASALFLRKTVTGVLIVEGKPESILARLWRQTLKVLVRESGV